jgi:hypothetical protein
VEFVREPDRDQQIRVGKSRLKKKGKKNPTEEEAFEAGKREVKKGEHKGKKFNLDVLLVGKALDEADGKSAKTSKSKKVDSDGDEDEVPKGKTSKSKKGGDDEAGELDDDRKDEVLRAILADAKNNELGVGRIKGTLTIWAAENDIKTAERNALVEALTDTDYLEAAAERGVIVYDEDEKTVTLKKGKKR